MAGRKGKQPRKRGMMMALILACGLVFAGLVMIQYNPALKRDLGRRVAGPAGQSTAAPNPLDVVKAILAPQGQAQSAPSATGSSLWPSHRTMTITEQLTQSWAKGGAVVGDAKVVAGNMVTLDGITYVLWGVVVPAANYTCVTGTQQWFCGDEAARVLDTLIGSEPIACFKHGTDMNGQVLGICYHGDTDLSEYLAEQGWALDDRNVTTTYLMGQANAMNHKRGLWATDFDPSTFTGN